MKKHMKKFLFEGGAAVLGLWVALFVLRGGLGPYRDHIQDDAREGQRINTAWLATEDGGEQLTALLFYPEDGGWSVFSLYRKDKVPLFGWHFRAGGSIAEIDSGVAELDAEEYSERAYLSMNAPGVCRVELACGERVNLDPDRPFALVFPQSAGAVTFYDEKGDIVESTRYGM